MAQSIKSKLLETLSNADQIVKKKDGSYVVRRGYFYTNGYNEHKFADRVLQELTEAGMKAKVLDKGDKFTSFKGGAPVSQNSHWWVQLEISA